MQVKVNWESRTELYLFVKLNNKSAVNRVSNNRKSSEI